MTAAHLFESAWMRAANCSDVLPTGEGYQMCQVHIERSRVMLHNDLVYLFLLK